MWSPELPAFRRTAFFSSFARCLVSISSMPENTFRIMCPAPTARMLPAPRNFASGKPAAEARRFSLTWHVNGKVRPMPYIQIDIEHGLTKPQKAELTKEVVKIVNAAIGSSIGHINVVVRESPTANIVEAGESGRGLL